MNLSLPTTRERVPAHTTNAVNRRLKRQRDDRVDYYSEHKTEIPARLGELDREWDIERAIEMNAATISFAGIVLGVAVDKRWLVLPAVVTGFLFQHAIQGWCPPVPVLRRMGFRTVYEIESERDALLELRPGKKSQARKGKLKSSA